MKRTIAMILCVAMLLSLASTAFAANGFTEFELTFTSTTQYKSIVSDTTSKAKKVEDDDYARLYVYSTTSDKNNVYRTYSGGKYTSEKYFKKTTSKTFMYYTSDIASGAFVYLRGRSDSSVSSCTVTGEFGAG